MLTLVFSSNAKNMSRAVLFLPFFKTALLLLMEVGDSPYNGVYFPSGPEVTIEVEPMPLLDLSC